MRTVLYFLIATTLLTAETAHAQPPDTLWTRTYGGSLDDEGFGVQQTSDGGYITTGYSSSYGAGSFDVYLIKTDEQGNEVWQQTFGGSGDDVGNSVQQTTDGGYIIAGWTASYGAGGPDVYLIKTDEQGNEVWQRTFGGSGIDRGRSVQQTTDGGYIIAGWTASYGAGGNDVYLIKTDEQGNEVWSQTFGGSSNDIGWSVQQTSDGGYIVAGYTYSYGAGDWDVYLIKTDEQGNAVWSQTFGGSGEDLGRGVRQTSDGGYIIAGVTASSGAGSGDVYLIKTDEQGNEAWSQTFGGSGWDEGQCVQPTSDDGYIIAGYTTSRGAGGADVYLIKTDLQGNEDWQQTFGGAYTDAGADLQQTSDSGYIIAGVTSSYGADPPNVYLIRLEAEMPPQVTITLDPLNPPIQIPAAGGSFDYNASLMNNETGPQTFDSWIMVMLPNGTWYGPVLGPVNLTLSGGASVTRLRSQAVPASAPAGTYTYRGYVGSYGTAIWDSSSFTFEKLVTGEGELVNEWENQGESFAAWLSASPAEIPVDFSLIGAYPNPFNPTTTIGYALPEASPISLIVYDINGRTVATLVDGYRDAGTHEVTFDASSLASGVYLYRLSAGEFNAVGKMVLMK